MFNPAMLLRLSRAKDEFKNNHPKFPLFLKAAQATAIEEGTIIEVKVTKTNGEELTSNIKLKASDVELFRELSELMNEK